MFDAAHRSAAARPRRGDAANNRPQARHACVGERLATRMRRCELRRDEHVAADRDASSVARHWSAKAADASGISARGTHSATRCRASYEPAAAFMIAHHRVALAVQADSASQRISKLLQTQPEMVGVRMGMVNDWGSHTGFTYTLSFVRKGEIDSTDERIDLAGGGAIFVERKALWVGEGGLVGSTIDLDDNFALIVMPKEKPDA